MERAEAESALAESADHLVTVVEAALPGWVEHQVATVLEAQGRPVGTDVAQRARSAGEEAVAEVGPALRSLLATDPDEQTSTPLQVIRGAVRYPTRVLEDARADALPRDHFQAERFPDDPYDLTPAGFADLGEEVHDAGLRWGVARAMVHKLRHDHP